MNESMNWSAVTIKTIDGGTDLLCAQLLELGFRGFAVQDAADFSELLQEKAGHWDYIDESLLGLGECEPSVTVYIPDTAQGAEQLLSLKQLLDELKKQPELYGSLEISSENLKEEDWANNWKQYFKPFCVGNRLYVKPSWEEGIAPDQRVTLEIDPASSFGTGQHHTTRLCLEFLDGMIQGTESVLDVGCGSGILMIGAMLLGAKNAVGVDIEEHAAEIARENIEKNRISDELTKVYFGNLLEDEALVKNLTHPGGYEIITANIVADVLIAMSPYFVNFLKKDGIIIISGIITERLDEVLAVFAENQFELLEVKTSDGWAAAKLTHK